MAQLKIQQLVKRFGNFVALDHIDLEVEKGEFVVLLGPSGCGKTTLLRAIAGLEQQDEGKIFQAGIDISRLPPAHRDYGIVFQSYALFPNLSVSENVAYGLRNRKIDAHMIRQRVEQMLALVGLPGSQEKFSSQLSGGQQQRVALARALATSPNLLLLDEPLSALDAIERLRLRSEIRRLQTRLGVTTIMVTHDQEEALSMADRIVVMDRGQIQQIGTPEAVYGRPENDFVADFIGRANILRGTVRGSYHIEVGQISLRYAGGTASGTRVRFHVRPEEIRLLETLDRSDNSFYAHVLKTEYLGAYSLFTLQPQGCPDTELVAQYATNYLNGWRIVAGATLRLGIPPEAIRPIPESS
jgi:iron(III) transport system ATP-binding protein